MLGQHWMQTFPIYELWFLLYISDVRSYPEGQFSCLDLTVACVLGVVKNSWHSSVHQITETRTGVIVKPPEVEEKVCKLFFLKIGDYRSRTRVCPLEIGRPGNNLEISIW